MTQSGVPIKERPSAKQLENFRAFTKAAGSLTGTLQHFVEEERHDCVAILKDCAEISAHLSRIPLRENSLLLQQACAFVASGETVILE
eukprot:3054515-Alexandrium_andersonii.AAC.1